MRDLLVITPSRGRPESLREMIRTCFDHAAGDVFIAACVDEDDPFRVEYADVCWDYRPEVIWYCGPRQNLTGWTNLIASTDARSYRALASFGDDHRPRTPGWDSKLLAAIDGMGGTGIAYGDDLLMGRNLPTAPVVSADIVAALGWMCEPSLAHMCVDCVWKDLGEQAGCLAWVPEVTIEHVHWAAGKTAPDATYAAAEAVKEADRQRYDVWRQERMAADVDTVKALLKGVPGGR